MGNVGSGCCDSRSLSLDWTTIRYPSREAH
jgi:hypothetical protein